MTASGLKTPIEHTPTPALAVPYAEPTSTQHNTSERQKRTGKDDRGSNAHEAKERGSHGAQFRNTLLEYGGEHYRVVWKEYERENTRGNGETRSLEKRAKGALCSIEGMESTGRRRARFVDDVQIETNGLCAMAIDREKNS